MSKIPKTASGCVALINEMLADPAMNLALRSVLAAQEAFGETPAPQTVDELKEAQGEAIASVMQPRGDTPVADVYAHYQKVRFEFRTEVHGKVQDMLDLRSGDQVRVIGLQITWAHEGHHTVCEYTLRLGDERSRWEDVSARVTPNRGEESVEAIAKLVADDAVLLFEGWLKTRAEKAYREASSKASGNRASSAQTGESRTFPHVQTAAQSLQQALGSGKVGERIRIDGSLKIRKD